MDQVGVEHDFSPPCLQTKLPPLRFHLNLPPPLSSTDGVRNGHPPAY